MSSFIDLCRLAALHFDLTGEWPGEARLDAPRLHALAHDLSVADFGRVSSRMRLRVRQTPGASVGGRAVVQLEHLTARGIADDGDAVAGWLGLSELPHPLARLTLDEAFYPRSEQWGLRGDAPLWEAMRVKLFRVPIPESEQEIANAYWAAASEIVGEDLQRAEEQIVNVEGLAIGRGMSDGCVDPGFWREIGMPMLVERAVRLGDRVW